MTGTTFLIVSLLVVISGLLIIVGIFYQTMVKMSGLLNGFISELTERLGPRVPKVLDQHSPLPIVMYVLSAGTMAWAVIELVYR